MCCWAFSVMQSCASLHASSSARSFARCVHALLFVSCISTGSRFGLVCGSPPGPAAGKGCRGEADHNPDLDNNNNNNNNRNSKEDDLIITPAPNSIVGGLSCIRRESAPKRVQERASTSPQTHLARRTDCDRHTALDWACYSGHVGAARLLIASGLDPSLTDGAGKNCLHWAASQVKAKKT